MVAFDAAGTEGRAPEGAKVAADLAELVRSTDVIFLSLPDGKVVRAVCADILAVPAAFTVQTGRAHWKSLLRARAIETGSFVIAPGQTGEHENGRKTWGHSLIINPWGEILAEMDEKPGMIMADLNLSAVKRVRSSIPALQHDREYEMKE